jgi:hypothetical protein
MMSLYEVLAPIYPYLSLWFVPRFSLVSWSIMPFYDLLSRYLSSVLEGILSVGILKAPVFLGCGVSSYFYLSFSLSLPLNAYPLKFKVGILSFFPLSNWGYIF